MTIKRRQLLTGVGGTLAASTMLTQVACSGAAEKRYTSALNVRDFGAAGDAKSDDTHAFQTAMDECARRGGGVVEVPTGEYMIKTHLTIPPAVTLEGVFRAPQSYLSDYIGASGPYWTAGPGKLSGSVLLAVEGAGMPNGTPFVTLNTNSTLKGLTIFYPNQTNTNPPVAYPWTVAVAVDGAVQPSIVDVLMVNPYQAVDFGSYASPRCLIRNLYAGAIYRGIYVDNCLDTSLLENVHFEPLWQPWKNIGGGEGTEPPQALTRDSVFAFTAENGEAFIFGRNDFLQVQNCFAVFYKVGFRFTKTSPAGLTRGGPSPLVSAQLKEMDYPSGNAIVTGGLIDISDRALLVEDSFALEGIAFTNCIFAGSVAVKPTNRGMIKFTSCIFVNVSRRDTPMVETAGAGRVSFSNCSFNSGRDFYPGTRTNIVHALGGSFGIVNCTFTSAQLAGEKSHHEKATANTEQHILIEPDVRSAIILGNDFSGRSVITNRSKGRVQIANNIDQTGA